MSALSLHRHSALPPVSRIELQCIFLKTFLAGRVIGFRGDLVSPAFDLRACTKLCCSLPGFSPRAEEPSGGGRMTKDAPGASLCGRVPRPRVPASNSPLCEDAERGWGTFF